MKSHSRTTSKRQITIISVLFTLQFILANVVGVQPLGINVFGAKTASAQSINYFAYQGVTVSSTLGSRDPLWIVDADTSTTNSWASGGYGEQWARINLAAPKVVDRFVIYTYSPDSSSCGVTTTGRLEGSQNGTSFTTLHTITSSVLGTATYDFSNTTAYSYYRYVSATRVNDGCGFPIFEMQGYDTTTSPTIPPTYSNPPQNVNHFYKKRPAASSTYNSTLPSSSVDGNATSTHWMSAGGGEQWLRVGLSTTWALNRIVLHTNAPTSSQCGVTTSGRFEGSADGLTYTTLYNITEPVLGTATYDFSNTTPYVYYRYVSATRFNNACGTIVYEMQGFDTSGSTATPQIGNTDLFFGVRIYDSGGLSSPGSALDHIDSQGAVGGAGSYMQLDLNASYNINRIRVKACYPGTYSTNNVLTRMTLKWSNGAVWDGASVNNAVLECGWNEFIFPARNVQYWRVELGTSVNGSGILWDIEAYEQVTPPPPSANRFLHANVYCCGAPSYRAALDGEVRSGDTMTQGNDYALNIGAPRNIGHVRVKACLSGNYTPNYETTNVLNRITLWWSEGAIWNGKVLDNVLLNCGWNEFTFAPKNAQYWRVEFGSSTNGAGTLWEIEAYDAGTLKGSAVDFLLGQGNCSIEYNGGPPVGHTSGCGEFLDPVNMASGNFAWHEKDLVLAAPGGNFIWSRNYNSRDTRQGALGTGWSLNLDARLDLSVAGKVTAILENGARSVYTLSGSQYVPPAGELAVLQQNGDGTYKITRPDQSVVRFSSTGRLLSRSDSVGRTVSLSYNNGALSSITDTAGRSYSLQTDVQGRVTKITDTNTPAQRTVVYTYTGSLLTDVKDLLNNVTHYGYTSDRLTSISHQDNNGGTGTVTQVENRYDAQGRVTWQDAWDSTPFTVTYDLPAPTVTVTSGTVHVARTSVEDAQGHVTSFDHDADGRLLRQTNADGQATLRIFDANNAITKITNPLSHASTFTYDSAGNMQTVRDATGRGTDYTYDQSNRLKTETDALGRTTTYTYTSDGLLNRLTNALGQTTIYTYSTIPLRGGGNTKLPTAAEDALGHVSLYGYNDLGLATVVTNALNQTSQFEYDDAGRLTRAVDPAGIATCNEYDAANNLTATVANCVTGQSSTTSRNVRTEYGYDFLGRPTWARDSLGEVTRTFYNSNAQVSKVVVGCAVNGTASTGNCDTFNSASPELNRTTAYGYDDLGRQVALTDTLGIVSRTSYDTLNRPVGNTLNYLLGQPSNPTTNVTSTVEYDTAGRVSASLDALGRRSVPHYDNAGRVTEQITNYVDGNPTTGTADTDLVSRTEYDAVGLPVTTTLNYIDGVWDSAHPEQDLRSVTRYDELGRTSKVIENYVDGVSSTNEVDTDRITEYRYNAVGNLIATIDPLGRADVTSYDVLNRPTMQIRNCTDSNGQPSTVSTNCATGHGTNNDQNIRTSLTYNSRGQVETQTDALGSLTRYTYDALGRVITGVKNDGGSSAPTGVATHYTYDALGKMLTSTDALSQTVTYSYDRANRLTGINYSDVSTPDVTFTYDGLGRRTQMTDGTGTWTYSYDALDRPTAVQDGFGKVVGYGYDKAGRITTLTYPSTGSGTRTVARQYNAADDLIGVTDWLSNTTQFSYNRGNALVGISYANGTQATFDYNTAREVTSMEYSNSGGAFLTFSYGRNSVGMLTSASESIGTTQSAHTYSYDAQDRLLGDGLTGGATGSAHTAGWTYDRGTQITETSYTPGTGNTTPAHTTTRTYDGVNELLTLVQTQGMTTTKDLSFTYSATGNRTGRTDNLTQQTTTYAYDQANRLVNFNSASSVAQYGYSGDGMRMSKIVTGTTSTTEQFTWDVNATLPLVLQDGKASYVYGPYGQILEEVLNSDTTHANFYHVDQLGSVRALTNSSGAVVNTYTYDAYGKTEAQTGINYNPFGYTGEYTDAESGLVYLRARYYDPQTQQFLTVDPLLAQTEQAYAYVGGSPVNRSDPSGLDWNCELLPNPFDENSCMRRGYDTEAGKWVVAGGVIFAGAVTVGFIWGVWGAGAGVTAVGAGAEATVVKFAPAAQSSLSKTCTVSVYHGSIDNGAKILQQGLDPKRAPTWVSRDYRAALDAITNRYDTWRGPGMIIESKIPSSKFAEHFATSERPYAGWNGTLPGSSEIIMKTLEQFDLFNKHIVK